MKTTFTLFLAVLTIATSTLNAQINKGSFALGGNISFSSTTLENDLFKEHQTIVVVSPSLLSFYKANRAMGLSLSYSHFDADFSGESNSYGAGISLRQYKPLGKAFYIFVQEGLGYDYTKGSADSSISTSFVENISHKAGITVNPGIAYDLTKKFQLELLFFNDLLSASYNHSKLTSVNNGGYFVQKYDSFSFGANLTGSQLTALNLGAKIFFNRQ